MTRKKSTGLLGLGLDLHRPLRSVRSSLTVGGSNGNSAASHQQQSSNNNNNRSTTTSKTRTPSHSPSQSPFQPTFENGTVERQQYASHHPHQQGIKGGNDFLLHDPFPSRRGSHGHISGGGLDDDNSSKSGDVVHNGGGSSTTTTTTTAPCTRRGRSWSSIFKRKKML